MLLAAFVGFLLIASAFLPPLSKLSTYATNSFSILAAIAFILGGGNFLRSHAEKVRRQADGWAYSLIAIAAFLTMLTAGLFKLNVEPQQGFYSYVTGGGGTVALAEVTVKEQGSRELQVVLRKAGPNSTHPVAIAGREVGQIQADATGRGKLVVAAGDGGAVEDDATAAALRALQAGDELKIGSVLSGSFQRYGGLTGEVDDPDGVYGYLYLKAFVPLQQTTFALLAFFVASAAFRAFRARNVESVLLLGTAFIILLGRTAAGDWMTGWLPDTETGLGSFFHIPNLSNWIMAFPVTAGGRAILIGIALGVISTSLKVLLGIDRSYLGSKGGGA